jgi:predicted nucleic acid-binding protein
MVRAGTGVLSSQVLQEYFVTVTRKLRVDAKIARRKVELLAEFDLVVPDLDDILVAIDLHRLHGFSFGDALVLRAAKESACSVLYSEDLQPGRVIDGVQSSIRLSETQARLITRTHPRSSINFS